MHSIVQSIGYAHRYLSEALLHQNYGEINESDTSKLSYGTIAVSLLVVTVGAYAIKKLFNTVCRPVEDTAELFWKELESNQRAPLPAGPVVVRGKVLADDLLSLQKEMFSACDAISGLFIEYIQKKGLKPKNVIDLGCGRGANSIPLLKYDVTVTAIDNMECLLESYEARINNKEKQFVSLQRADLTTLEKYSTESNVADIALAIDVLPYLPISCWKSTMEKIVLSLKPGGYFFGTVFVKRAWFNDPVVAVHERFGAQYYPIRDLAARLMVHSGLEMVECRVKKTADGCYEFVARKPIINDTQPFFNDLPEGKPLMLVNEIDQLFAQLLLLMSANQEAQ